MAEEDVQKLTMIEQNLSSVITQKQTFQKQIFEIDNALEEIKGTDNAYQISGAVMIKKDAKEINKYLASQKETITVRLETLNKQEKLLREQMNELHKKIFKDMK